MKKNFKNVWRLNDFTFKKCVLKETKIEFKIPLRKSKVEHYPLLKNTSTSQLKYSYERLFILRNKMYKDITTVLMEKRVNVLRVDFTMVREKSKEEFLYRRHLFKTSFKYVL